ncbi:Predicted transcriptional regulators containing the CopG/Arc/MetJ DNA-binding domain [Streptococcus pyogenes]|uniref:ribbon-helix-helix domain-containing protein n=1 Tax=Streptococcus pyogenes TaxID=1314 RepID=UPI00109BBC35|nr:hypothetical protein [Streptococcus pyogenes]VGQ49309.1 Predicted transcriptional regulators containing the CopG/Arc/MetJ DNA-binding domain [Streptococcus pyogenes]VGW20433.1 Predicted transcriptional regulators containing the CopG/Arc/MetJ DNA-binding domain [Streptococcus pyogenes]VHA90715.1 Predicted transcriptional regulators containing the CopG/Arc/MetJ DNA-binding domain [Streptococcus pyogenes]VHC58685.1 Predicted transcriptional regulators containing the CopG/Arc/MetJ DNA-binding do
MKNKEEKIKRDLSLTVRLTEEEMNMINKAVGTGKYGTASDYIRALLRKDIYELSSEERFNEKIEILQEDIENLKSDIKNIKTDVKSDVKTEVVDYIKKYMK